MTLQPSGSRAIGGAAAQPLVSVCINNYNYAQFLGSAIDSVLAQDYPFVELVVVDDGSTDDSLLVLDEYAGRGRFISKENGGQVSAVNACFAASTGAIVIFLDSDDTLEPHAVSRVVREWTDGLSKVQFRLAVVDPHGTTIGTFPHRDTPLPEGDVVPELLRTGVYATPTTSGNAYSRAALEQIMPIRESFAFWADGYLNARAPFWGPVHSIDDVLGTYRQHGANQYAGQVLDGQAVRRRVVHELDRERELRTGATAVGLPVPDDVVLRLPEHVLYRLLSLRMEPATHPVPTDRRSALLRAGVRAVVEYSPQFGLARKATWTTVLVVVAFAPLGVARRAADWLVSPRPRPPWLHALARGIDTVTRARPARPRPVAPDADPDPDPHRARPRVLLLFSSLQVGGAERNVVSLLPRLSDAGVDPTLCTLHAPEGTLLDQEVAERGLERVDLAGTRLLDPRALGRLVRRLRSGDVDLLHTEDKYSHILGGVAAGLGRVPVVMTRHVMKEDTPSIADWCKARLDARAFRRADRVIAVSDAARTGAIDSLGVAPSKIVTVYNGLGDQAPPDRPSAAELRSAMGWPADARVVTMIAALRDGKGHEVLFEAVPAMRDAIPELLVVIVGGGERESELRRMAAPLGDHVQFLGERRDVATLLAGTDVVVLPSFAEALPTVLLEAAVAALPVVATDVGGTAEIVVDGVTGHLVPAGDADALARALISVLRDPDASREMGQRAQQRVEARFSIERQAQETAAVYRQVLDESKIRTA